MLDIDQIEEYIQPENLPPAMRELIDVIGLVSAIKLIMSFGGQKLYISGKLSDNLISYVIGEAEYQKLWEIYRSDTLIIPKSDALIQRLAHIQVRILSQQGKTSAEIAQMLGYTQRHVFRILSNRYQHLYDEDWGETQPNLDLFK